MSLFNRFWDWLGGRQAAPPPAAKSAAKPQAVKTAQNKTTQTTQASSSSQQPNTGNIAMSLTAEQIATFENALEGAAPAHDPNWAVTQQLLKLVTVQGKQIIELQAQLDAYMGANNASSAALMEALQRASCASVTNSAISETEARAAIEGLNQAVTAYQSGQKIAQIAGGVLKFAAKLIL